MSTSYIFLAGALFLFVIAIVILFMGKGKKDDKKVDKEFDENYAVNINEVYLRTGDVRETLVQMHDSYEDYIRSCPVSLEKRSLIWMVIMGITRLRLT
mgnify:CR=1 FL=1